MVSNTENINLIITTPSLPLAGEDQGEGVPENFQKKNVGDWLQWLENLHPNAIDLGLMRITKVAAAMLVLPVPHLVITVGGTNGKGSCVATLESLMLAAGYSVGAYTSPHLLRFNERIRICGQEVTDEQLLTAFEAVEAHRQGISLTYFEFTTLAALWLFRQANLDVIVLEVGLGGRLDAVNIVDADVAIITTVDYDHCDWLGDSIEQIAYEKSGILRAKKPAIYGDFPVPINIVKRAQALSAPLFCLNEQYVFEQNDNSWSLLISEQTYYEKIPLPTLELKNVAAALMALYTLRDRLFISRNVIEEVLTTVHLPARFQLLPGKVTTILDVAHNPQAARLLAKKLLFFAPRQIFAVFSMLSDKDMKNSILPLAELITTWYVAELSIERAATQCQMREIFKQAGIVGTHFCDSIPLALQSAQANAREGDVIVVFGSFYTVASVMREQSSFAKSI